ncbi:DUF1569 domain-containing protein [Olleya aquimaris]|uniref:Uncharacterized protein DUF1569 n=1 Tax=Olleya aquimaris TaxID=639310 RepID=A0A327REV4_9FLAO|nr:DUF1569 domain-containing protein [Olleya aquimaris]RAJ14462.1 uncharacterized protein DUF1569 [Olleya aquimaris]
MKSLFETEAYNQIKHRLNQFDESSQPTWGKMTVGQMAHHCQVALNIALQKEDYGLKPNWLINFLFKKSMYNDKLWKPNMPTARAFKVSQDKDFITEKQVLENLIDAFYQQKDKEDWHDHPSFGKLTKEQWGQMQYKHLDHHLRQFGV